ncbi:MAG: phosphopantetheine-binding protein [Bryobacteraceae bacterium]
MDKVKFYQKLAEILDIEEVKPENILKDLEQWDSLAILAVLAMADSQYGVTIQAKDVRSADTAESLANLVEAQQK